MNRLAEPGVMGPADLPARLPAVRPHWPQAALRPLMWGVGAVLLLTLEIGRAHV